MCRHVDKHGVVAKVSRGMGVDRVHKQAVSLLYVCLCWTAAILDQRV